jgi:hypothetical protein
LGVYFPADNGIKFKLQWVEKLMLREELNSLQRTFKIENVKLGDLECQWG